MNSYGLWFMVRGDPTPNPAWRTMVCSDLMANGGVPLTEPRLWRARAPSYGGPGIKDRWWPGRRVEGGGPCYPTTGRRPSRGRSGRSPQIQVLHLHVSCGLRRAIFLYRARRSLLCRLRRSLRLWCGTHRSIALVEKRRTVPLVEQEIDFLSSVQVSRLAEPH